MPHFSLFAEAAVALHLPVLALCALALPVRAALPRPDPAVAASATVASGNVTASLPLFGLMVNGDDIAYASGTGWTFDGATVSLTNAGPFVLSTGGATFTSNVAVVAQSDCAVTFAHLEIFAGNHARLSPFTVAPGVSVALIDIPVTKTWNDPGYDDPP